MLGKIWDDTLGGPQPDSGLNRLRNHSNFNISHRLGEGNEGNAVNVDGKLSNFNIQPSLSMESSTSPPSSPTAASSPSSTPRDQENVWRSVFNPGSNPNTNSIGSQRFDKVEPNSPTVYDWLYSEDTKSKRG